MPRLFVAVELPRLAAERLALIRSELSGARWMAAENMHITLRFAGDVTDAEAREFAAALDAVDGRPFPLKIQGVGHFGGRETTAVWAGIAASGELDALQRAIDRAARAAGLPPEGRAFKPHVTLARLRGTRASAVARFLEDNGALACDPFTVARFALMSARPGTGGGPYAIEEVYEFGGGAAFADADRMD